MRESGLQILDIPAAMNSRAGGSPVSSGDSPRNQKMSAERAELARLDTHAHSIPFCVPQQNNVEAPYAAHSESSLLLLSSSSPGLRESLLRSDDAACGALGPYRGPWSGSGLSEELACGV